MRRADIIKFVEEKSPDMKRIARLLELCKRDNHWANRGPLYQLLIEKYSQYLNLDATRALTPCANAGVALEAMSRVLSLKRGRPLRWVGSSFSFQNLGRGHFADIKFVDCNEQGLLDLERVRDLDGDSFDGLVVVNPFGHSRDFSEYIAFARTSGKALLIDNAAGIDTVIPDWPWQAFSLHHTKPFGFGEGGLALTPSAFADDLYALLDYGRAPENPSTWLNNGKLSDVSCAFLIDRLEQVDHWAPLYRKQAERVHRIASEFGLRPLSPVGNAAIAMSWAFVADEAIPTERVSAARQLVLGKYYKPLRLLPRTVDLFSRLVNIPTHPDVAVLSDDDLRSELSALLGGRIAGAISSNPEILLHRGSFDQPRRWRGSLVR